MQKINSQQIRELVLVVVLISLLTIPAIYNLLKPGFFASHDGEWMIIRFSAFYDALREGQFPVRWLGRLNSTYGYPAPNFAYPLFMYFASLIHVLGFGIVNSIKILIAGSFITSAVFTYLWLRRIFQTEAAILGAIIYTYTPYHIYNLYTRGSVGELVALSVLPFLLWQIEKKSAFFIAVGTMLLLLSHNILALLFFPLVIAYTVIANIKKYKNISLLIFEFIPFVLGLGMSAFFFIPAAYDFQYIIFEKAKISVIGTNFVTLQLFGFVSAILIIASGIYVAVVVKKFPRKMLEQKQIRLALFFTVIGVVVWFLTNPISIRVWDFLPKTILQYPFRMLCLIPIVGAFLSAFVVSVVPKYKTILILLFSIGVFFGSLAYLTPKEFFDRGDMFYANNFASTTVSNEYTPRWVEKQIFVNPEAKVVVSSGNIQNLQNKSNLTAFFYTATETSKIRINTTYFPGWQIYDNNKKIPFSYQNTYGVMEFQVEKGEHTISARFGETPIRLISDLISIASFLLLLGWVLYVNKRKGREK